MKKYLTLKNNKGYGLMELIFYVSVFAVVFLVIINSIIVMVSSFKEIAVNTDLVQSAQIMERISREAKLAKSYKIYNNSIESSTIGDKIEFTSDESGSDRTVQFYLKDNTNSLHDIVFSQDLPTSTTQDLNSKTIDIVSLKFEKTYIMVEGEDPTSEEITSMKNKSFRVVLTVSSRRFGIVRTATFYDTIVLRGKYENT